MNNMRAIQQQAWGGADQLKMLELARPTPLSTEVLARIRAAGVNLVDVYTLNSSSKLLRPFPDFLAALDACLHAPVKTGEMW